MAARPGQAPVTRGSVLTLWDDRPAEVGAPRHRRRFLRGFVERVGDPVPLVAATGPRTGVKPHRRAVEALARVWSAGRPRPQMVVAVPRIGTRCGRRTPRPLRNARSVSPEAFPRAGVRPPHSTALAVNPGLPDRGVIALRLPAPAGSITMVDAGLAPIGETVRFPGFSGDQIVRPC